MRYLKVLKNVVIDMQIDDSVQSCKQKLRSAPVNLYNNIEVTKLIIFQEMTEPVKESSAYISNILVSLRDKKARICSDMRQVNIAVKLEKYPFAIIDDEIRSKLTIYRFFTKLYIRVS